MTSSPTRRRPVVVAERASMRRRRVGATFVAVIALAAAAACGDSDDAPDVAATTAATSATTRAEARSYRPVGPAVELGTGDLVGMSASGSAAYVAVSEPGNPLGCEGRPAPFLFAVPLDGGPRVRAVPGVVEPVHGDLVRSPDNRRVAVVEQCEEFFVGLRVGEERDDTLRDLRQLRLRLPGDAAPQLTWSADGHRLLGAQSGDVIAVDPASGAVSTLRDDMGAVAAAELDGGTLVVLTGRAVFVGESELPGGGWRLVLSPDRTKVAITGTEGLRVVGADGQVRQLAGGQVATAAWSPDGRALAYTTDGRLRVLVPGSAPVDVAEGVSAVEFSGDAKALVFSQYPSGEMGVEGPKLKLVALA